MEFSLERSDGARINFNGTREELDEFLDLIRREASELLGALGSDAKPVVSSAPSHELPSAIPVGPDLEEAMDRVGASTDVERVTVIAYLVVRSTGDGLSEEAAAQAYTELGLPRPGRWRSTFGNARMRGYLYKSADGWRPTPAGENFATHGIRRAAGQRRG